MARQLREGSVDIIGTVMMVRVEHPRTAVIAYDGQEIEAPFRREDEDVVTTALKEHASLRVRVQGRGRLSSRGRIREITEVASISLLPGKTPPSRKPIWEVFAEILRDVPEEELRKLPRDGSANHDHYIYGLPKRDP